MEAETAAQSVLQATEATPRVVIDDRVVELRCKKCDWVAIPERWRVDGKVDESATEGGVAVVPVTDKPEWGTEFVVQGCEQVTRYRCPECEDLMAVLAAE